MGVESECAAEYNTLIDRDLCGLSGTGSGSGCASLGACCTTLPPTEQPGCNDIVAVANDTTCGEELTAYQTAGFCTFGSGTGSGSGGGGCAALSVCCGALVSSEQPGCNAIVGEGDDSTCSAALVAYEDDGFCAVTSGSGTGGDGSGS
jgi:hypothetical protein